MNKLIMASAIIVAGGKGSRMKTEVNKQYLMLSDKPVLAHTIEAFEKTECISEIIVVIQKEDQKLFEEYILNRFRYPKITAVTYGGKDRQASVYQGLLKTSDDSRIISVHDGARPLISRDIITDSVETAMKFGAACVGVPVKDTIKRTNSKQMIEETLERTSLWSIQTPQVFKKDILKKAHENARHTSFRGTDDSVLVESLGYPVHMVKGSYTNIKITTPEDLVFAETMIRIKD